MHRHLGHMEWHIYLAINNNQHNFHFIFLSDSPLPSGKLLSCRCHLLCSWWLGSPGWTVNTCAGETWVLRCGPPLSQHGSSMKRWPTPHVCSLAQQGSRTASSAQTSVHSGSYWTLRWTTHPQGTPCPSRSFSHAARGHFAWMPGRDAPLCSQRFLTGCQLMRRMLLVTSACSDENVAGVWIVGQLARLWSIYPECTRSQDK